MSHQKRPFRVLVLSDDGRFEDCGEVEAYNADGAGTEAARRRDSPGDYIAIPERYFVQVPVRPKVQLVVER